MLEMPDSSVTSTVGRLAQVDRLLRSADPRDQKLLRINAHGPVAQLDGEVVGVDMTHASLPIRWLFGGSSVLTSLLSP